MVEDGGGSQDTEQGFRGGAGEGLGLLDLGLKLVCHGLRVDVTTRIVKLQAPAPKGLGCGAGLDNQVWDIIFTNGPEPGGQVGDGLRGVDSPGALQSPRHPKSPPFL